MKHITKSIIIGASIGLFVGSLGTSPDGWQFWAQLVSLNVCFGIARWE